MAEIFRGSEPGTPALKTPIKYLKPSDVYIPIFDPDVYEFTAAQWCDEIDHHRTQNSGTDYETRNFALRGVFHQQPGDDRPTGDRMKRSERDRSCHLRYL